MLLRNSSNTAQYRVLSVQALAMHISLLIYAFIVYRLSSGPDWVREWRVKPELEPLFLALCAVSLMAAVGTVYIPFIWAKLKPRPVGKSLLPPGLQPSQEGSLFLDYRMVTSTTVALTILRLTMAESIAVFGLILAFTNESVQILGPFILASLALQLLFGPFFGHWLSRKTS